MNDLEKIELAIRRAAAQMPNHASRQFRLVADEIQSGIRNSFGGDVALAQYRVRQHEGD